MLSFAFPTVSQILYTYKYIAEVMVMYNIVFYEQRSTEG